MHQDVQSGIPASGGSRAQGDAGEEPANLPKGAGYRKALEILRETGQPLTAMELAYLALQRLGREPSEPAITMLAKTIHSSFSRQKNPVVTYDRSSTWPGKWRLL